MSLNNNESTTKTTNTPEHGHHTQNSSIDSSNSMSPSGSNNNFSEEYLYAQMTEKNVLQRVFSMDNFDKVTFSTGQTSMEKYIVELSKTNMELSSKFLEDMKPFLKLFQAFNEQQLKPGNFIDWSKIKTPLPDKLHNQKDLVAVPTINASKQLLQQLVVLKLNGGLGTTMGCTGPKSIIEVRGESSFLDLTVRQIEYINDKYGISVPLVLMNSFNTHKETLKSVQKYVGHNVKVYCFNQKMFPRIDKDTLLPMVIDLKTFDQQEWYPPGHGDVFDSFYHSQLFEQLQNEGKKYVFISNVDNLGATVNVDILQHLIKEDIEYCMEVTQKTRADVKGGTMIDYDGQSKLLELPQVPKDKLEEFKSIKKFKIFNTNNIWVKMASIKQHINDFSKLDVIVNRKEVGDRKIIQLETACGSAIGLFQKAIGLKVHRSRFLPVKNCSDLMLVQSSLYSLEHGSLVFNPKRIDLFSDEQVPLIKLGDEFRKVAEFRNRCPNIPDIIELDHLTVSGNVYFGKNVSLRGNVIIVAYEGSRIDIPDGCILENKVVTGNLRIQEH